MNAAQGLLADTWMHGGWGWWMPLMMIPMLLFWGAVIFGIVWLVRSTDRQPERRTESPIDVLDRRFAEGLMTEEDYRARREVLVNGSAGSNGAHEDQPVTEAHAAGGRQR